MFTIRSLNNSSIERSILTVSIIESYGLERRTIGRQDKKVGATERFKFRVWIRAIEIRLFDHRTSVIRN